MDSTIDSAIAGNQITPARKWNIYSQDVIKPIFKYEYKSLPGELGCFIPATLEPALVEATDELGELAARAEIIGEAINSINPIFGILKRSEFKYTPEYYDLRILDSQLSLVKEGDVCLLFSPKYREYFVEKKCKINVCLIGSNIIDTGGRLESTKREVLSNNPDDMFYLGATNNRALDQPIFPSFKSNNLDARWEMIDRYFLSESSISASNIIIPTTPAISTVSHGTPVDIIIHVESSYGKNPQELDEYDKSFTYDFLFFEPAIRGLNLLKNGGTMILKLQTYGIRFITDLIYLYKYLFRDVMLCKTSTLSPISQEYYLVARNYKKERYIDPDIKDKLNKLLALLWNNFKDAPTAIVDSFIANLDNIPNTIPKSMPNAFTQTNKSRQFDPAVVDFIEWIIESNKQIGFLILTNIKYTSSALTDKLLGFLGGHTPIVLDHVSYRQALGYHGRMTLYNIPELQASDELVDEKLSGILGSAASEGSVSEMLTETGQLTGADVKLDKLGLNGRPFQLGASFIFYNILDMLTEAIIDLEIFRVSFLPALGTIIGQSKISVNNIYTAKRTLMVNIRQWLGLLYSLGDLEKMMWCGEATCPTNNQQPQEKKLNYIKELLSKRQWSILDIFNVSLHEQSPLRQISLDGIYQQLAHLIGNLGQRYINDRNAFMQPDGSVNPATVNDSNNVLSQTSFYITPLKDLRFRIGYCYNGSKYAIMQDNNPSVLGEFELVNLLTDNEKSQISDVQQLTDLISKQEFIVRMVEHICLPVYFSGTKTELAVPDMYFKYRPDVELFASATNRYAPIWCSANPEDLKLGSSGNFYDFIRTDNPIYSAETRNIRLMMAFPPLNSHILTETLDKCFELFAFIVRQIRHGESQNIRRLPFGIVIIYANAEDNEYLVEEKLKEYDIDLALVETREIKEAYDPFIGKNQAIQLKAISLKSQSSQYFTLPDN